MTAARIPAHPPAPAAGRAVDRRPHVARLVAWSLVALAAALLAWHWVTAWPMPARDVDAVTTSSSPAIDLASAISAARTSRAFGGATPTIASTAPPVPVAVETTIRVRGVYALRGGAQMAIVDAGEGDRVVRVGTEIAQGVRLKAVAATHVVVDRGGRDEKVLIDFSGKDRPAGSGGLVRPPTSPGAPQGATPPGFVPGPMLGRGQPGPDAAPDGNPQPPVPPRRRPQTDG